MKKIITILLFAFLLLPVTIIASSTETKPPANGKLNSYKDDFQCDRGYTKNFNNWSCDPIKLPENGILTVAGNDWTCIANYKRVGDICEKVKLPEHAKYFVQGPDWYCEFGYQKQGDQCIKLELPSNARWSYDGNYWECNKGFVKSDDQKSCIEIKIPENAQSNYIGTFTCNSGYKKVGESCEKQPDITNGYFYTTGSDFYCAKGFKKNESERKCEEIKIPDNAHRDDLSLEGWSCNSTYDREGDHCKQFTLPEHAFWFNNTWDCEQGYRKNPTADSCDKINLPENAHYTNTYDGWLCNEGYTKNYKENSCEKSL